MPIHFSKVFPLIYTFIRICLSLEYVSVDLSVVMITLLLDMKSQLTCRNLCITSGQQLHNSKLNLAFQVEIVAISFPCKRDPCQPIRRRDANLVWVGQFREKKKISLIKILGIAYLFFRKQYMLYQTIILDGELILLMVQYFVTLTNR